MTEQDLSFGRALFGRHWPAIAPAVRWIASTWRRAMPPWRGPADG